MNWCHLPYSEDAERAILGSILLDNRLVTHGIELLTPDDFYLASHRKIFLAMIALHQRGAEINPILLAEELRKKSALESVGGVSLIANLTFGLPHTTDITGYAHITIEHSRTRTVLKRLDEIAAQIGEGDTCGAIERARVIFNDTGLRANGKLGLNVVRMADVKSVPIAWLWFPFIPLGKITLLEGEEGLGKSYLTCAIASAISRGDGLPNDEPRAPANVLLMTAEDGLGDTIRPRLDSMGADVERIFAVDEPFTLDRNGMLLLEEGIMKHQPVLVVIDPLFSYTGANIDINRANESRAVSARLAAMAGKHNLAFLLVRHIGKSKGNGEARAAGLGSVDWRAAARSDLLVGQDPETHQKGFVQTKHNLTSKAAIEAIGFQIVPGPTRDAVGQFDWTGPCTLTAAKILASVGDEDGLRARNDAANVLREILHDGPKAAEAAYKEMRPAGFSDHQTRRARVRLGVISQKEKGVLNGKWIWALPSEGPS